MRRSIGIMATLAATPAKNGKACLPGFGPINEPQTSPQPTPHSNYRNRRHRRSSRRSSLDITQKNSVNRQHTPSRRASLDLTQPKFVRGHRRYNPRSSINSPSSSLTSYLADIDLKETQRCLQHHPFGHRTFSIVINTMTTHFPVPPRVDLSTLDMDLVEMPGMNGFAFGMREIQVLNNIRSGPAIIDYWNEQHPLWTELKCVFNNDPNHGHLIPATIGAKLTRVIERITHECTDPTASPSTRVSGIYALLQIIKWVCQVMYWPLKFHELDFGRTFWYRDDRLAVHATARADDAMTKIIVEMPRAERELIHRRICQLPIVSEMEHVIWEVARVRLRFRTIRFFKHIHVALEIIEGAALVRK